MLIIGENINATNKAVAQAIETRDVSYIADLVQSQMAAGADFIDVNAGIGKGTIQQHTRDMEWLIETIQKITDKPLTIDSDNPAIIEAGLNKYYGQKVMINSVNGEPHRLEPVGTLAAKYNASLIALAIGSEGSIPDNVEERIEACAYILKRLTALGLEASNIFFDPLVIPVAVDPNQAMITLKTIEKIKETFPETKTAMGLSNISFGLPNRQLVNRGFLLMAAYAGLDAVILNPLDTKTMSLVKVANMLTGKDQYCRAYNRAYKKGILLD